MYKESKWLFGNNKINPNKAQKVRGNYIADSGVQKKITQDYIPTYK